MSESMIDALSVAPSKAVAIIDFQAAGTAGSNVTINGVVYQEANVAVAASGIWTNGANAADSTTSLIAAINGDLRPGRPRVTAFPSVVGDSVIVVADEPGVDFDYVITTTAANATVENMAGGDDGRHEVYLRTKVITAQDVLADEVTLGLTFTPARPPIGWIADTSGLLRACTGLLTVQTAPLRLRYDFAGATDPIAGDVLTVLCYH